MLCQGLSTQVCDQRIKEPQTDPALAVKGFRGQSQGQEEETVCAHRGKSTFVCQPHCLELGGPLNTQKKKLKDHVALGK